jgi:hypothetical protein
MVGDQILTPLFTTHGYDKKYYGRELLPMLYDYKQTPLRQMVVAATEQWSKANMILFVMNLPPRRLFR